MTDEILTELHDIKDALGERCAHDYDAWFQELQSAQCKLQAAGVTVQQPPPQPEPAPPTVLQRLRFAAH